MWFVELFSCCSKPVLPGSAWVLLNHVLQTLFLSSANFCLALYLNLYHAIGCGLYIKSPIHPPAFIACKTVPLLQGRAYVICGDTLDLNDGCGNEERSIGIILHCGLHISLAVRRSGRMCRKFNRVHVSKFIHRMPLYMQR